MIEGMKNIAHENAMQTQATILLAKEARRDSEIMKVIAFVTMVYLPATFVCVS
jgi:Mg2+ and Co2+ transporter CorA